MVVPKPAAVDAIAKLGIQLPATAPLNSIARARVITLGAYQFNAANIEDLTKQPSLALDAIRASSEPVYSAVLERMTEYLAMIAGRQGSTTIDDPQQFLPVLTSAHDAAVADEDLQRIVEAASAQCHVDAIADAPQGAWPALAATRRVTVSAANLLAYLDGMHALDESIGPLPVSYTHLDVYKRQLLNGTEQVRRRRRVHTLTQKPTVAGTEPDRASRKHDSLPEVKFVYALRDSVFEQLGGAPDADDPGATDSARSGAQTDAADVEVRRANRTKFFDIVIPIVPFITHRNARDLMLKEMEGTGVSRDLINVVARFVADMRLITNMRNEYDIYADRLLHTPNQMPGIDADRLFALIVYKCVHIGDFEAIPFGNSDLDRLHDAWRNIVKDAVGAAQSRDRAATEQLALERTLDSRAKQLGDRLELVMQAMPAGQQYPNSVQLHVGNTRHGGPQLRSPALWTELANNRPSVVFYNSQTGSQNGLTTDLLQMLMGVPLDAAQWAKVDRAGQIEVQRQTRNDIAFLRHHTWREIYQRSEFTSAADEGKEAETFEQAAARILKSRLARALVASGYLNEYFALYVSIYYGQHLRPRALNYIVHALDRGVADFHAELDGEDVEAIIGDKGIDIFRDRAAYNVDVYKRQRI